MSHMHLGQRFEHARLIVGSPKAGTARPDVCRITKLSSSTVYYRNESGMSLKMPRSTFGSVVGRFIEEDES